MSRVLRAPSRDHESIITMLSHAMSEEHQLKAREEEYLNEVEYELLDDDEFDEAPSRVMVRTKSNPGLKVDFCCLPANVIRCVCANIIAHIQSSENVLYIPPSEYDLFNKESGCLDYDLDTVSFIFSTIHRESQMEFECIVIALIYLERIPRLTNNKLRICALNWRYLLFTCMMLSSKIWDDLSMINSDYATIFSNLPLEKINAMEVQLLKLFDFSIKISLPEYEKMNKTIKDLNVAAIAMHLRLAALPSPLHSMSSSTRGDGVSISGRHAFSGADVIHRLEDEDDEESDHFRKLSLGQMDESSTSLDTHSHSRCSLSVTPMPNSLYIDGKSAANTLSSSTKSTWSASCESRDLEGMVVPSVRSSDVIEEQLESIHEHEERGELLEEVKQRGHRRRTSVQIAIDNALLVLVKYFPGQSHHAAKVHVTTEKEQVTT